MKQQACVLMVASCLVSGLTYGQCSDQMDVETLTECITIEGSGADYQEWKQDFDKQLSSSDGLLSPITGKDIREMAPAAGKPSASR